MSRESTGNPRHPVLVNGEHYIQAVEKKGGGGPKELPRSYDQAVDLLQTGFVQTAAELQALPEGKKTDAAVFCLRLNPRFTAKSYFPDSFLTESALRSVGSRKWDKPSLKETGLPEESKLIFVRSTYAGIERAFEKLNAAPTALSDSFKNDARIIDEISLLRPDEQILGFEDTWTKGLVEFVLHPLGDATERSIFKLRRLLTEAGVDRDSVIVRSYASGPTFLSAYLRGRQIETIASFNPLRTAHPLASWKPLTRSYGTAKAPQPSGSTTPSTIKLGIFDGGADDTLPLLAGHCRENSPIATKPEADGIAHGTWVAGAALYGPLDPYGPDARLPAPRVFVESFRVLPTTSDSDHELYEIIDVIEKVIPQRPDIKVYNLSFGPRGPILDDDITRFTFALDSLAYANKVLFVVACGNDGGELDPMNRIQCPSDLVNGLGIGAWTYKIRGAGTKKPAMDRIRSDYSCIGPGREGGKIKPDLCAFGGDRSHPFVAVGPGSGVVSAVDGTSFSSPVAASMAAELAGRCDRVGSVMARAMLIHGSKHPEKKADLELGHGFLYGTFEDIVQCDDDEAVALYQGSINPGTFAKLPLPCMKSLLDYSGRVSIKWTLCVLSKPDMGNPGEYTTTCIEDLFYPNSQNFSFYNPSKVSEKKLLDLRLAENVEKSKYLIAKGWKKSAWPKTESIRLAYGTELQRKLEFKWDTVVSRAKAKDCISLHDPFIILHALERNSGGIAADPVFYALVATIKFPGYRGSFYSDVAARFNLLQPIAVRTLNEIRVQVI